jgi:hypothetical protein
MNPKLLTTIISLLILVGLMHMWPFKNKSSSPKIVETKTFSCPGMEGFTFEYPLLEGIKPGKAIFKSWPNGDDICTLPLSDDKGIIVTKRRVKEKQGPLPSDIPRNPNNIYYTEQDQAKARVFYTTDLYVTVWLGAPPAFPKDLFFQIVIKSFRAVK